ncbi:hypothetical protein P7K49_029652 [Saguinus oedipus]|uniref:Uncharacterized protein n=1 Tax=Saguinus oedipus TaxID=9490 RepID=A0ABQ9U7T9_SAGOE|nr:hypothetical protein P7K49_029652 [Saguinus oedipus]
MELCALLVGSARERARLKPEGEGDSERNPVGGDPQSTVGSGALGAKALGDPFWPQNRV